jgi:hypothetical protein
MQLAMVNLLILITTFQKVVLRPIQPHACSALTVLGVLSCAGGGQSGPALPHLGLPGYAGDLLAVSGWMLWHLLEDRSTRKRPLGLATAVLGLTVYFLSPKKVPNDV